MTGPSSTPQRSSSQSSPVPAGMPGHPPAFPSGRHSQERAIPTQKRRHVYSSSERCRPLLRWGSGPAGCADCTAINVPCWLQAPDPVVPQRESEGEGSLGRGIQPPPPTLNLRLSQTQSRRQIRLGEACGGVCEAQRGERPACSTRNTGRGRKTEMRPSTLGNPLEASLFPEERNPVNQAGGG